MQSIIIHRVATTAIMPLVAASGWAGYSHYSPAPQPELVPVCTTLVSDLYYAAPVSNDVAQLQRFLISAGYLRSSVTGYFGQTTLTAVERYQADQGIPISGVVDWQTRDLIRQTSCGAVYPDTNYQYSDTNGQLSVDGIDTPRQLAVGQSSAWTVRVLDWNRNPGGSLHYTVVWGDENIPGRSNSAYPSYSVQSSGTFTHTYVRAGTYRPVFTVTDDYGNRATVSATVLVFAPGVRGTSQPTGYYSPNVQGCTGYYDRSCYMNGQYIGANYGGSTTYNGPGDTCYFLNGQWQGSCGTSAPAYQYVNPLGGPSGSDYSCYYDRGCLARLNGTTY